jgi:methylthioribulose-1-phosphate dehydratase
MNTSTTLPYLAERLHLIDTARQFHQWRWLPATGGNLSFQPPEHAASGAFFITRSGRDKGALTPEDFLHCGPGGQVLAPQGAKPSDETLLHEAIYHHLEQHCGPSTTTRCIIHVHTVANTVLSRRHATEGRLVLSGLEMLKAVGTPTHDTTLHVPILANTQAMAEAAAHVRQLPPTTTPGILLAGHGLYAWGDSPQQAQRHVEGFEFLFEVALQEATLAGAV